MTKMNMRRSIAAAAATVVLAANALSIAPVFAQQNKVENEIAKHPTMTGIAAGVATTKAIDAKRKYDLAHGKKLSWAERHPKLSGIGVGLVTRHEIKKHMHPTN